jgi:hypothetical protein
MCASHSIGITYVMSLHHAQFQCILTQREGANVLLLIYAFLTLKFSLLHSCLRIFLWYVLTMFEHLRLCNVGQQDDLLYELQERKRLWPIRCILVCLKELGKTTNTYQDSRCPCRDSN